MGKTIGQQQKEAAERFIKEKQTLMNVLRERIRWHLEQFQKTADPVEQEAHVGLIEQDQDTLEDIQALHAKRKKFYKTQKITLPDLK